MTMLDTARSVCVIETEKIIHRDILKQHVIGFVGRMSNVIPKGVEGMKEANVEMTENTMHQIDYSRGVVPKNFYKRVMNIGFMNRATLLELETSE